MDTLLFDIELGERLVLCSDGLSRYVPPDEIRTLARSGEPAATLIAVANARGGIDNITAVVLEVLAEPIAAQPTTAARLELLRSFPLFERATYQELAEVNVFLDERRVKPGRLLFREGDPGAELYLMCDGEVVITRNGRHLATLGGRTVFGEMALVDAQPRSASALITRPTTLLVLGLLGFEQLIRSNEALASQILGGMVRRLSHVVRRQNEAIGAHAGDVPTDPTGA